LVINIFSLQIKIPHVLLTAVFLCLYIIQYFKSAHISVISGLYSFSSEVSRMPDQFQTLTVESLAYGGDGVGHLEGRVMFIPGALPGDVVRIRVAQDKGSYLRGELLEVVSPSTDRVEASCQYASRCGGCQWQELSYPAQLRWKRAIVEESMRRLGGIEGIEVAPCIPSPIEYGYRTVARYPARHASAGLVMGYHERRSHRIVDIGACPLAGEQVNRIADSIRALPGLEMLELQEITIQASHNLPSAQVRFTLGKDSAEVIALAERMLADIEGLQGVSFYLETSTGQTKRLRIIGTPFRYEQLKERIFRIDERSFFQINIPQAENLVTLAGEMLKYGIEQILVDGYGGVGLFSLSLAPHDATVYLFDVSPWAVEDSRFNAAGMGFIRFTGMVSDANAAFSVIGAADRLIIDPPRTGLGLAAVKEMCRFKAERMVYISCNPTTLARDLRYFSELGYKVKRIVPVDMFPHTYHIETASELEYR
jgi:23S rRNA (uracil1939-C5)-methyltransferase